MSRPGNNEPVTRLLFRVYYSGLRVDQDGWLLIEISVRERP